MIAFRRCKSMWIRVAVVLLATGPAAAVDGVVLIDQARALAGNVTVGDGVGFPVSINAPGSYRLAGNLSGGFNGIEVNADDVTLDLNGFGVSAGNLAIYTGRRVARLVIRNGSVTGARNVGIHSFAVDTTIERVNVGASRYGILVNGGEGARVTLVDSTIGGNTENGVSIDGADCRIEGNQISGNGTQGLTVAARETNTGRMSGGCTVARNVINRNGTHGIVAVWYGADAVLHLRDNTVAANGGFGLMFDFGASIVYGGNVFVGNNKGSANAQMGGLQGSAAPTQSSGGNVCGARATCP